ncbi:MULTISPECIES: isocitrate/isopropylmalate family dehydrogenase [Archaeoglobus]|jgi:isopropylmalate/isohomocitrate dehydrogenase-like protein|uniref:3-isopropylmalate dehydrogenase n=3 Tax=Archaeoglobus fulgidus TaxID=2234 RepID=LEU3_ARCFU|nr:MULTISPECIES: isocitrate/isopropylmalate family dehydrogenase [Archaeoglobus]O29627.1 RecName: Full=3-isopropylmalate dehydrogenase; Short=3-IPM-DH; Short=IMDH; AltName: Full=Beta-IPM dehydrogenase [Archaeoglobus fulgidus DSM 4304]AAB90611.1 3-isopropylmalate dehydrogenase (leuB) [Archaeoglobus fulgidus DSM 4304]AIG97508.1 isopropylmalate/isohomocitrate dehydrogenase [Archaeoglobus fulgidus DSM 8774]KUJ92435.1 MAG: 3-isopropylmalate dehydrogenase [Archaeoglobus fulgidus]KUK07061.1 MAG: 3-is
MKKIVVIPGDGIGKEVMEAAMLILEKLDLPFEYSYYDAGDEALEKYGKALPDETLEACRKSDAVLFGAAGETAADVIVRLRRELGTFANVRPAKAIEGIECLYPGLDIVVVRENTECLYMGFEFGFGDVTEAIRVITREASERIARYAFELAKREGRKKVTALHKANVMKKTCGLFRDVCREVAKDYPEIQYNDYYIDAACMYLVMDPFRFDVIVTTNMFGDIVSDLAAGLVGGLGLAPSANVGERTAIFEPVHGAAFDIAGKGIANPTAMILTACMMLRHFGYVEEAKKVEEAVEKTIKEGKKTPDLGGNLKTMEFANEVASLLD